MRQEVHFGRELVLAGTILGVPALVPVQHRPLKTPSWARLAFLCVRVTLSILLNLTMLTSGRRRLTTGSISMGQYLGRRIRLRGSQQQQQQREQQTCHGTKPLAPPPAMPPASGPGEPLPLAPPPAMPLAPAKADPQRNCKKFIVVMIYGKSQRRQTDFCDQSISLLYTFYTKDLAERHMCGTTRSGSAIGYVVRDLRQHMESDISRIIQLRG